MQSLHKANRHSMTHTWNIHFREYSWNRNAIQQQETRNGVQKIVENVKNLNVLKKKSQKVNIRLYFMENDWCCNILTYFASHCITITINCN